MEKPRKGLNEGRVPLYEDSLKIALAKDYIEGKFSYRQLGLKYNLSAETVRYFVRWYQESFAINEPLPAVIKIASTDEDVVKELALARLKLTAMEMLIKNKVRWPKLKYSDHQKHTPVSYS